MKEQQHTIAPTWLNAATAEADQIQESLLMLPHPQVPELQTKLDITCPLYTVTTPLIWHREAVDVDTWTWFHEIRYVHQVLGHIWALYGW